MALEQSIADKGNEIRSLKENGISKDDLAPHVAALLELKDKLAELDNPKPSEAEAKAEEVNELRASRLAKVDSMREAGVEPFAYSYVTTHTAGELLKLYDGKLEPGEEDEVNTFAFGEGEGKEVRVAGRIMARRVFGKLAFYALQDETGVIQLQFDKKRLGERDGDSFKVSANTFCSD